MQGNYHWGNIFYLCLLYVKLNQVERIQTEKIVLHLVYLKSRDNLEQEDCRYIQIKATVKRS